MVAETGEEDPTNGKGEQVPHSHALEDILLSQLRAEAEEPPHKVSLEEDRDDLCHWNKVEGKEPDDDGHHLGKGPADGVDAEEAGVLGVLDQQQLCSHGPMVPLSGFHRVCGVALLDGGA